jgi:hypothetical protein
MIRCHDCGKELTPDTAVRRDVVLTTASGVLAGTGLVTGNTTGRVDLCAVCTERRDQADIRSLRYIQFACAIAFLAIIVIGVLLWLGW